MDDRTRLRQWAREEFGAARLGDARRTARLVAMATDAALSPSGRVSSVFSTSASRQGAYDFLESPRVDAAAIGISVARACAQRASDYPFVFLPLDGTSLNLTDHARTKDFGSIGSRERGARGLKIIDAIAVSPNGLPLGVANIQWWARPPRHGKPKRDSLLPSEKELQHWLDAIIGTCAVLERDAPTTRGWFQVDREGDDQHVLETLVACGHWFTVRSRSDRRLHPTKGPALREKPPVARRRYLRARLARRSPMAYRLLEVPAQPDQPSRLTCVSVRTASVQLHLLDRRTSRNRALPINVVWVREHGGGPMRSTHSGKHRSRALDWLLLTNHPVATMEDVDRILFGYSQRWRIEDFHRAWKSGVCNVEDTQLRARAHVIKWATVLAAVAIRAERLKHLAREQPARPASDELSATEIEALILLKRRYRKRTETINDDTPTLETATRWIAELGGYTGKSSGGPPGSITIARGLERLRMAADVLEALRDSRKKR